jgi:hypothetical protein
MVQNTLERVVSEPIRKEPVVMQGNVTRHGSRAFVEVQLLIFYF